MTTHKGPHLWQERHHAAGMAFHGFEVLGGLSAALTGIGIEAPLIAPLSKRLMGAG
jgi:hypothetical protein